MLLQPHISNCNFIALLRLYFSFLQHSHNCQFISYCCNFLAIANVFHAIATLYLAVTITTLFLICDFLTFAILFLLSVILFPTIMIVSHTCKLVSCHCNLLSVNCNFSLFLLSDLISLFCSFFRNCEFISHYCDCFSQSQIYLMLLQLYILQL